MKKNLPVAKKKKKEKKRAYSTNKMGEGREPRDI